MKIVNESEFNKLKDTGHLYAVAMIEYTSQYGEEFAIYFTEKDLQDEETALAIETIFYNALNYNNGKEPKVHDNNDIVPNKFLSGMGPLLRERIERGIELDDAKIMSVAMHLLATRNCSPLIREHIERGVEPVVARIVASASLELRKILPEAPPAH